MIHLASSARDSGKRLDHFLQEKLPQYSRSRLQEWIRGGRVRVDGNAGKPSSLLRGAEAIHVEPADLAPLRATPEDIPLDILYEDADVIAINKPAGMVVHAGAGRHAGTLTNALLHRFETLSQLGGDVRPGIVHRLDRETSGVLLVARTDEAHRNLAAQFANRKVEKVYVALVEGRVATGEGHVETPIMRDPIRRTRMTTKLGRGRSAITDYRVLQRFANATLLEVRIGTGRTHQIRVHLASIRHPVVGDKLYGAKAIDLGRFFLHARSITFTSPSTGERVTVTAELAGELKDYLASID
jgi:23S rRNA pseudouridine1911/1915/1917 synthase